MFETFSTIQLLVLIILTEVLVWDLITKMLKIIYIHICMTTKHYDEDNFTEIKWPVEQEDQNEQV